MVTFLTLVPDQRPPFFTASPKAAVDEYAFNGFLQNGNCSFLSNYDGQSVDSMSTDSDSDFDMEREPEWTDSPQPGALLRLLANSLVLAHIAPFLSAGDKFSLAATSRTFHALVRGTPSVFKYLDLTRLQRLAASQKTATSAVSAKLLGHAHWCDGLQSQSHTPFYRLGPYHDVFNHLHHSRWLASVNTLILDNTGVDADLVRDLLTSPSCNVRILSLRSTPSLNMDTLRQVLKALCDQTVPGGTPKLKGLYIFGANDAVMSYHTSPWTGSLDNPLPKAGENTSELWYRKRGRVLGASTMPGDDWAGTLADCRGKIAFDGVLCNGPRHANSPAFGRATGLDIDSANLDLRRIPQSRLPPGEPNAKSAMAALSLGGCAGCGSAPEGWTTWGDDHASGGGVVSQFPLLWPPPRLSANVRVAMCPDGEPLHPHKTHAHQHRHGHSDSGEAPSPSQFIARCEWCVYGRLCACCMRWWCESCRPDSAVHGLVPSSDETAAYSDEAAAGHEPLMKYSCRECGPTCPDCLVKTERSCKKCRQSYCVIHNVGCTSTHCDWCSAPMYRSHQPIRRAALVSRY